MLTNEELIEIAEQADCIFDNITFASAERIFKVLNGDMEAGQVVDSEGEVWYDFTVEKLRKAWEGQATIHGWEDGTAFYRESTEHDALDYDNAMQIAIFGEVVYG